MANKPCKRCGSMKWWWSDGYGCSKCSADVSCYAVLLFALVGFGSMIAIAVTR
jgi:hypothetical protein